MTIPRKPHLEVALEYAALGYKVFPCKAGQKIPATKNGRNDATTKPEQIEAWWKAWPEANIGLATDGLMVIDIDGSENPWPENPDHAIALTSAPTSCTPSGGKHRVFRQPEGKALRSTAGRLAKAVDTRADGGYIVVPPSRLADGGQYAWIEGLELEQALEDLPEPPAWLLAQLDALSGHSGGRKGQRGQGGPIPGNSEPIPDGQRNYTLARLAGTMRRAGMSRAEILAALFVANRERCKPPLDESEVQKVAESIARYEAEKNGNEVPFEEWDCNVFNFDQIEDYPQEWLWENRIPKGTVTIIEGPPKVGKTTAMVDWISRLTNAQPLPFTETGADPEPVNCMILAPEDPINQVLKPRLCVAGAAKLRVFYLRDFSSPITKKQTMFRICQDHLKRLAKEIQGKKIGLLYIDAIMGILPEKVDEKSDKEVRQGILDPLVRVAEKANCAIVIGRHWAKGASMRLSFEKGLGSIGWSARARSVLQVAKDPDDPKARIFCVAASNGPETSALKFKIEGAEHTFPNGKTQVFGRAEWVAEIQDFDPDSFGKAPDDPKASEKAIEWLLEYLEKNGVTLAKSVDEAARQAKIGHKALKDAKAQLKKDGRILYDKRLDGWWVIPTGSTGSRGSTGAADPVD